MSRVNACHPYHPLMLSVRFVEPHVSADEQETGTIYIWRQKPQVICFRNVRNGPPVIWWTVSELTMAQREFIQQNATSGSVFPQDMITLDVVVV